MGRTPVDTNGGYSDEVTKPREVQPPVSEPVTLTPAEYEAWKVQEKQRMREELIKELQQELILPSKGNEGGASQGNQSQSPDYSAMQYDQSPLTKTPVQEKKSKKFPMEHDAKGKKSKDKSSGKKDDFELLKSEEEQGFDWSDEERASSDEDWKRHEKASLKEKKSKDKKSESTHENRKKHTHSKERSESKKIPKQSPDDQPLEYTKKGSKADVESAKKKGEGSMKTYLDTNEDNASKKHFQATKNSNNGESPGQIQEETKSREVSKDREDHFDSYQDMKSKKEERLKRFREN